MASSVLGNQQGVIYTLEDRIYACLLEQPLEPGEIRLVLSRDQPQAIGVGPIGDFEGTLPAPNPEIGGSVLVSAETGFTETIGEMPAQLIVRDGPWCPAPRSSGPGSWPSRAVPICCGGSRRSCADRTSRPSSGRGRGRSVDALRRPPGPA